MNLKTTCSYFQVTGMCWISSWFEGGVADRSRAKRRIMRFCWVFVESYSNSDQFARAFIAFLSKGMKTRSTN